MKSILFLTILFLFAGVAVAQDQANVQFSIRVADFQSIQIDNNTSKRESGSKKYLVNNTIKIVGSFPYELQINTQSNSYLPGVTNLNNNKSLTISSHDAYDNSKKIKTLSKNDSKILQGSKTSMELSYNPSNFLLSSPQVAHTQIIAYSLMPN